MQGANDTILAISSSAAWLLTGTIYAGIERIGLAGLSGPVLLIISLVIFRTNNRTKVYTS